MWEQASHVNLVEKAQWQSTRLGSDSGIIHADDYAIGDTFFITVHCMNECSYDVRPFFANEHELKESERQAFRFGGHMTQILKYTVPDMASAEQFVIQIEPEVDYRYLEVYLSHGKSRKSKRGTNCMFSQQLCKSCESRQAI